MNEAIALTYEENIEAVKLEMIKLGLKTPNVEGFFTPGLYTRVAFFDAGDYIISEKHKTEHPFCLLSGKIRIINFDEGEHELEAPFIGVTAPGTIRFAQAVTKVVWATFHPTKIKVNGDFEAAVKKVEKKVIEKDKRKELRVCHG